MQACVYRFHRNARNVFQAECIINKVSLASDAITCQGFSDLYHESVEEYKLRVKNNGPIQDTGRLVSPSRHGT